MSWKDRAIKVEGTSSWKDRAIRVEDAQPTQSKSPGFIDKVKGFFRRPGLTTALTSGPIGLATYPLSITAGTPQETIEKEKQNLPYTLATVATLPLGGIGGVPGIAARVAAQGAAGFGGELAKQKLNAEPIDIGKAGITGVVTGSLGLGGETLGGLAAKIPDIRGGAAQRALGVVKRFIPNKWLQKQAKEAAEIALEKGVISPLASPEDKLAAVEQIGQQAGEGMQKFLDSIGQKYKLDLQGAVDRLEALKPQVQKMGSYEGTINKIDNAIETLKAHGSKMVDATDTDVMGVVFTTRLKKAADVTLSTANKIKGELQSLAKSAYKSASPTSEIEQQIASTMRDYLDTSLDNMATLEGRTKDMVTFLKDKKISGAMKFLEAPLQNLVSTGANRAMTIPGAGMIAREGEKYASNIIASGLNTDTLKTIERWAQNPSIRQAMLQAIIPGIKKMNAPEKKIPIISQTLQKRKK